MPTLNTAETTKLTRRCPFCGRTVEMEFNTAELRAGEARYRAGALMQNAFPNFSPNQREFLKTGICDECWDRM